MKVLVTGAAGFIGFYVALRLLGRGDEIVGLDNMNDYYDVDLKRARVLRLDRAHHPQFRFVRHDITDTPLIEWFLKHEKFNAIVHLAAQAGVRYSVECPHECIRSNIIGMMNILEGCRNNGVEHLVYASSSSVYGGTSRLPFSVHDAAAYPLSLYAATKRSNELMAHSYSSLFGLPTTGLRFFTVYGPWGRPDMAIHTFTRAIMTGKPIQVFNEGRHTRDFTFVDDAADAVLRALDLVPSRVSAPYSIHNIGSGQAVQLTRCIELLEKYLGIDAIRTLMPMQLGDVQNTLAEPSELMGSITPIEAGLLRFVDWFKSYYGSSC
jgi:UDP-glucuronate 4-epimerase